MPRLLLVDDASDVALIVGRLGRRLGSGGASTGRRGVGLGMPRDAPPDLVLLDLNLTGERGEELCRRVRATPDTAALPVALFVHMAAPTTSSAGWRRGPITLSPRICCAGRDDWQARLTEILVRRDGLDGPRLNKLSAECPSPPNFA